MLSRIAATIALFLLLFPALATAGRTTLKHKKVEAALSQAREALFGRSDVRGARAGADEALALDPKNLEALFVRMEAATLQADVAAELDSALCLVSLRGAAIDSRTQTAAARILDLAADTAQFRAVVPRLQLLAAGGGTHANYLRAALITAAQDGAPGLSVLELAHASGLITDWRIAGPFGRYSNVDFDRPWPPERDALANAASGGRTIEQVRSEDGNFNLPDYFERSGVLYAVGKIRLTATGERFLRFESAGTARIFVDGKPVLTKDDRFRATPEIAGVPLHLRAGWHTILVKFIPSAIPFRVAILPRVPGSRKLRPEAIGTGADAALRSELAYASAAKYYWPGEYVQAIAELNELRVQHPSVLVDFLLSQAWMHTAEHSPEESSYLSAAAKRAPDAFALQYELAARAQAGNRTQEALQRLRTVIANQPEFPAARELAARMALDTPDEPGAADAIDAAVRLHASCSVLRDAIRYYSARDNFSRAQQLELQLESCAPGSLAYANLLSDRGEHARAASAARAVIEKQPLNRYARFLLVRELALSGARADAHREAQALASIAPNSDRYRLLGTLPPAELTGVSDENTGRAREFVRADPFCAPYRHDGVRVVRDTAERTFSGGPAVTLLEDRAARLAPDGATAVYVHRITRVLNRDGIEQYGEVAIPRGAAVLELRTIKPDGSTAEPELNHDKATISMPGLAPGDAIEQEYVVFNEDHDGIAGQTEDFHFTFGSFRAPILFSRFVVITPRQQNIWVVPLAGAPEMSERVVGDRRIRIWERNDIAQSMEESSTPRRDVLPSVRILPELPGAWAGVRDYYRDLLIDATRVGARVSQYSATISLNTDEEKARALYRFVTTRLRPDRGSLLGADLTSAEDTLASGAGSRTATLIALARAAGLSSDLVLARDASSNWPKVASYEAYSRPLVAFHFPGREVVVDAELEGSGFGQLPANIASHDALLVPAGPNLTARSTIVAVPQMHETEKSIAHADVTFNNDGDLSARLSIRFGATRSTQMRSVLSGIAEGERQHFFEQLAMRIFPGVTEANGEVRNQDNPDQPLELLVDCRAPNFLNVAAGMHNIDQLIPALGLRKMYAGNGARRFPLYIDSPLFESTEFRVQLPPGVHVANLAPSANYNTPFGSYSVSFRLLPDNRVAMSREFHVPVQVITPGAFSEFVQFATQIEDTERQRITLEVEPPTQARSQRAR